MKDVKQYVDVVVIEFVVSRISNRETIKSNYLANKPIDYYKMLVFLPNLNLLVSFIKFNFIKKKKMEMIFLYYLYIQKVFKVKITV